MATNSLMCAISAGTLKNMVTISAENTSPIRAQRIRLPVAPERGGLIRYMDSHDVRAKPNERFMYEVLALIVIESGTVTYIIDSKRITLTPLSVIWCFPDQKRTILDLSPDLKTWVIEFTQDFLRATCTEDHDAVLKQKHEDIIHRQIPASEFQFTHRIFTELLELGEPCAEPTLGRQGENDPFNAGLHYILQHYWRIFRSTKNELRHNELHPAIAKAVHIICDEDGSGTPVSELAKQCGISASRIVHLFHTEVGMTITEFRNRQKLERFFFLYSPKGPHTMLACALDAGFGSYPQFFRIFRQSIGMAPKEYFG